MDFVLDELIIVMFLAFIILLFISSIIATNFYTYLLLESKDLTRKTGISVKNQDYLFDFQIRNNSSQILEEKVTHFKDE